jgi:hypothetical protein
LVTCTEALLATSKLQAEENGDALTPMKDRSIGIEKLDESKILNSDVDEISDGLLVEHALEESAGRLMDDDEMILATTRGDARKHRSN